MGSAPEQAELPWGNAARKPRPGRTERRNADAARVSRRAGELRPEDDGLVALVLAMAHGVDVATRVYDAAPTSGHGMALAQLGRVHADALAQLRARAGGTGSAFDAFLAGLSAEEPHRPS